MPSDVITEKVYCTGQNCGGYDAATMALLNNNQWNNNPFALMLIPMMMRMMWGDNWQQRMYGDPEIQARFNQLSNQMSDNHNTDILNEAVKGNTARIGELASNLGIDHRAIQSGICDIRAALQAQGGDIRAGFQGIGGDVRAGFQGLQGDVRFTGERVINANLMGVKDMQSAFKDCCCENRLAQKDTLIAMKDQTYTLNDRLTGIANGLQKGFSDLGYILAQQKGEIINNQDRNTQRVLDQMCANTTQALRDQLAEKDRQLLAANIVAGVKANGCGCGAA